MTFYFFGRRALAFLHSSFPAWSYAFMLLEKNGIGLDGKNAVFFLAYLEVSVHWPFPCCCAW